MKFELTVNLDEIAGDTGSELGRILRYWGGATKQLDLNIPQSEAIYDSSYTEVGSWRIS